MKTPALKNIAFISVDNTKTFEDKNLNELYVPEWEQAAFASKKVADFCKTYGILTINVLEKHPLGHVSLAANYKNKKTFETITHEEVQTWTEEDNGIAERAEFNLSELKKFLSEVRIQRLWPDHSIQNTEGVELTQPLQASDFDLTIVKGTNPGREAYSGFDETILDDELKKRDIKKVFISWVATDYCVGKTAEDGADKWFEIYVLTDAIRGVAEASTKEMLDILTAKWVKSITTEEFKEIISQSFDPETITD